MARDAGAESAPLPLGSQRTLTADRINVLRSWRMFDQIRSVGTETGAGELERWLKGKTLLSYRRLIIQLMRHTQALNSGNHCPQAVRFAAAPAH